MKMLINMENGDRYEAETIETRNMEQLGRQLAINHWVIVTIEGKEVLFNTNQISTVEEISGD